EWLDQLGRRPTFRIGVNTGEVIAGNVGEGRAMDYGVLGDVVNVAARLQQSAAPGEIFVGGITHDLAAEAFLFEALPPLAIKGKGQRILTLRVLGAPYERPRRSG